MTTPRPSRRLPLLAGALALAALVAAGAAALAGGEAVETPEEEHSLAYDADLGRLFDPISGIDYKVDYETGRVDGRK